jgi:DNA-binding HxlR family transcriptional regulator
MSWSESGDTLCPIARCLAVVGDRWTMLIMRELFFGNGRFDGLQAQTGMSPHLLSTRLKRLEADGVLARRAYQQKPPRYEYVLTERGQDLHPILMTLAGWGRKWGELPPGSPALHIAHRSCGHELQVGLACKQCGETFERGDLDVNFSEHYVAERERRQADFQAGKARGTVA